VGGAGLSGSKRVICNVSIHCTFGAQTQVCSFFVLKNYWCATPESGARDRTGPFVFDQGRNGETLAEGSELSSIGSPTGVPSW